ncbi:uncharacterized protein LOC132740495 [Ruditapes philippinarum]|uniref:uncharacterized protein LOC132740495 n=1 Tax=Ruditapes philippinarum TaxID=129788 RepID=UPI00295B39E3|nr:uncharacterized protein LOC132740495 [Ruditapes philippinarum]
MNLHIYRKLRKAVNENQNNWDKFLDGALFSMRMAPQASTKYSPFRLLYGREPCVPSELPEMPLNLTAVPPLHSETLLNEFVEVTEMKRTDVEEKVKQNIKTAQEKQKKDYKKRKSVGYHEFGVGDTVKLFNSKKKAKKGIVLEENYLGPYEIINITGKKCSLKCKKSGKVLKSNQNIDNIKHFKKESGNKSMNEFLESLSKMGILQDILDGCQQFNLPKVKSIADIETAMNDPVYSFVSEVSKSNEGVMDVAAAIITPFVTSTSLTQKTDIVTIASSVFTKAYVSDLSPKDEMHSLEVLPPFFKKTPPMEDLEKSERIIVNGESVAVEDIQTLKGKAWLNDRVVNAYLKNLARSMNDTDRPKAFVIPSYTGTLWSHDVYDSHMFRKVKFGLFEYILMPWCLNSHWVLLVANVQKRTVGVVDSMHGDNSFIIARFCQYMMQRGSVCEPELADCLVTVEIQTNKQQDGCSCGVFVLMNAECILKGKSCLLMRQVHVDPLRKHIKNHLLHAGRKTNERECDGLTCKKPRGPSNWIQCDMCHRWWHRVCGQVERKQIIEEYLCQMCVAQYH